MTGQQRILLVMASAHQRKGGPSTAVRALAEALTLLGHRVTVTSHDDSLTARGDVQLTNGVEYRRFKLTLPRLQYSFSYGRWLRQNAAQFDAAVVHSLFLPHTAQAGRALRKARIPFAVRPHGSINPSDMRNKRKLKVLYLKTIERPTLRAARFLFCTSDQEAATAQAWGETVVIPLGANRPMLFAQARNAKAYGAVFIGRITEKKGIEIALDAFARLAKARPDKRFLIAGPDDEGLLAQNSARIHELESLGALEVRGPVGEIERDEVLSNSEVFVLPSRDENFGIAVAEAMAAAVPVVITPGVSHSTVVNEFGGGLVVERTASAVAAGIAQVWNLSDDGYNRMAKEASQIARERYSWEKSSQLLIRAFEADERLV